MADAINNTLSTKYYWRDWLVVVYKDMSGEDNHWRGVCSVDKFSVDHLHWKKMYNIIVSSVDKTKDEIHDSLARVETYTKKRIWLGGMGTTRLIDAKFKAKDIYNKFPAVVVNSCRYMITGVVKKDGNFEIRAPNRRKNYSQPKFFHLFALG